MILSEGKERSILKEFLEGIRYDIIKAQTLKGLIASGKSAEGLIIEVDADAKSGKLIDTSGSFEFQEYGRGPTTGNPMQPSVRELIYQWLAYRKYGFDWADDAERESMSYAITKKIHKKGTYIFIQGKQTGVLTEAINQERINSLGTLLEREYKVQINTDIIRELK